MAKDFRYPDRDQSFLLPPDMRDWLSEDHLAWWLIDVLDSVDVSGFEATSRLGAAGRAPYAPRTLLGVLLYGYAQGQRSTRQLERLCEVDVAFRILAGNASGTDAPDHSTLARFRQRHNAAFEQLFTQVLVLCAKAGLGRLGMVANASKAANSSESRLREKYAAEVAKILAEADEVDAAEDEQYGDARGDEVPPSWSGREGRKERIRAALADIEAERAAEEAAATPTPQQQQRAQQYERVVTDSTVTPAERLRLGRPAKGADLILIARATVERQLQIGRERNLRWERTAAAAAAGLAPKPVGSRPLPPAELAHVRRAQARLDALLATAQAPESKSAGKSEGPPRQRNTSDPDSRLMKSLHGWVQGYNCQLAVADDQLILAVRATQDANDTQQLIPMMAAAQQAAEVIIANRPTPTSDCSGTDAERLGVIVADAGYLTVDNLNAPGPDRLIALGKGHALHRDAREHPAYGEPPADAGPIERMGHRLRTSTGSTLYKRRSVTVEPVNGHLKDRHDLRTFSRRGLSAVTGELNLTATVANLMKLYRSQTATA